MTDREILELLVKKFDNFENRFDNFENRFDNLENRFDSFEKRFDNEIKKLNQKVEQNTNDIEEIKKELRIITVEIDTCVKDCLRAYSDGYIANREKMDNLHIDEVNDKIRHMYLKQDYLEKEIDLLKLKIG